MAILLGIVGIILGSMIDSLSGAVFGFCIGALTGSLIQQHKRIGELAGKIDAISSILRNTVATPVSADEMTGSEVPEPVTAGKQVTPAASSINRTNESVSADTAKSTVDGARDRAIARLKEFFTTGNVVVKVGVIVLFFGVGFLLKYAADRNAFPIEMRLASVAAGGIVMLVFGWQLRLKNALYALVLQGGAVGLLYITVFSAAKLYAVLPLGFTFAVMVALVAFSCFLAVIQNARNLAIFATVGGFLAPVLTSDGSGSHVALFSYYAVLNAGILSIAWYRSWRILNWIGFVFTFVIASLWGYEGYRAEYFSTTEPFLILFFVFYVTITVLFAHRQPPELKGAVDGSLVFGVPLVGFALQSALVADFEYGRALSALAVATVYITLARVLWHRQVEGMRLLTESYLALGVIFASLAIPFALDGHWTAATWALEGAGITWVGIRQQRLLPRVFGLLLQLGGAVVFFAMASFISIFGLGPDDELPVLNSAYIGSLFVSIAGLFTAYQFYLHPQRLTGWEKNHHRAFMIWGLLWWFGAGIREISIHLPDKYAVNAALIFIALSVLTISLLGRRLQWRALQQPTCLLLPVMMLFALAGFVDHPERSPLANLGYIAWLSACAIQIILLRISEKIWPESLNRFLHAASMWLFAFLTTWVIAQAVNTTIPGSGVWPDVIWGLIPALLVAALLYLKDRTLWPIHPFKSSYLSDGLIPVIAYLATWVVVVCLKEANPAPLPYIPILNPQDIVQLLSMAFIFYWLKQLQEGLIVPSQDLRPDLLMIVLAGIAFIWLNSAVAHTVHFYAGVEYSANRMFQSDIFQTSISIVWTLTAFSIMGLASRFAYRILWFVGTCLLGAVVIKLFIVDLADIGTIARIVSFMSVGILMLVIGYVAPLPPKTAGDVAT